MRMAECVEKHECLVEVNRVMDIIINSLNMGQKVFPRELISDSADVL